VQIAMQGAKGLMQLMPYTAKLVSKQANFHIQNQD
jgi:soluble lytic murein transglycosylase-like protein